MIFKKKIKKEIAYKQCDFCDHKMELNIGGDSYYIETCPICGKDMCPDHRNLVSVSHVDAVPFNVCDDCNPIWSAIFLYDRQLNKLKEKRKAKKK